LSQDRPCDVGELVGSDVWGLVGELVVDQDPRARQALRDLLYGASDAVDVERIRDLADGLSSYTTTTKTINNKASTSDGEIVLVGSDSEKTRARDRKNRMIEAESSITLAKDSADILLAPEGNLLQNLLIEESALAISASSRTRSVLRSSMVLRVSATLYLSGWDPS
jgi:spore cortex formation protein SpoVR/YcgB (stage V sporulation)